MKHELLFALLGYTGKIFIKKEKQIYVNESLTCFHPSEIALLNRLLQYGSMYSSILEFQKCARHNQGQYMRILSYSFDKVILEYKKTICELEGKVLKNRQMPLTSFLPHLHHYCILFPALLNFIKKVEIHNIRGCQLLSELYQLSSSGFDIVSQAMTDCHIVLLHQITGWLLHGILVNQDEFFIQKVNNLSENEKCESIANHYIVKAEYVPCYISMDIALKILFIGQSVLLFTYIPINQQKINSLQNSESDSFVWCQKESEFAEQLENLCNAKEFSLDEFQQLICTMRNIYLLARGELFHAFLKQADSLLSSPVQPTAAFTHGKNLRKFDKIIIDAMVDITMAFQLAAQQVCIQDDILDKITISLHPADNDAKSGWTQLCLKISVSWPLHIIFSEKTLSQYNKIMQFLLQVRRTQLLLHDAWAILMQNRGWRLEDCKVFQLLNHMVFLLENLQYYLMADVLESHSTLFKNSIINTRDFETIHHAHDVFLNSIMAESFLLNSILLRRLHAILDICCSYSIKIQRNYVNSEFLQTTHDAFYKEIALFFQILIQRTEGRAHLIKLLLRLDYNKFFSNMGTIIPNAFTQTYTKKKVY